MTQRAEGRVRKSVSLQPQPPSSGPTPSLQEMEASASARVGDAASAHVGGGAPATIAEEAKNSSPTAEYADPASSAGPDGAWNPHEVPLRLGGGGGSGGSGGGYDAKRASRDEYEEADVENPEEASLLDGHHAKEHMGLSVFGFFKLVTLASALYKVAITWGVGYDSDTGDICPSKVICATTIPEKVLLSGSRFLAGALYASLSVSVVSKCYASRAYLHHSWLGTVLDFEPAHDLHTYFGFLTLLSGFAHGCLHLARVIYASEAFLMYETDAFRSGIVAVLLLLPIVLPMRFRFFHKRLTFQFRKAMHMLFLVLLVVLCFHSVTFRYVGTILLLWYSLDQFFFITKQTFLVSHPTYEAIGRGTMVGIDLPEGYHFKAGSYIYVNCPAIDRAEWHPFSLIPVPGATSRAAFYAEAVGDWTKDLFRLGLANPSQPLWITAAQPSLVETTLYYDNVLLICTGAGITPAVAVADRFATKKNIHLMWIARDHGMIALFEKQLRMVTSTVHLTGSPELEVKEAMSKLLARSTNKFCTKKGKWVGDAEAGELLTHQSLHKLTHSSSHKLNHPSLHHPSLHNMSARSFRPSRQNSADASYLSEMDERTREDSTGWGEHGDLPPPVAHDVKLNFGRPDIAKFILDSFNATPSPNTATGLMGTGLLSSTGGTAARPGKHAGSNGGNVTSPGGSRLDTSQVVEHLDAAQQRSRTVLIRASSSTVENINKARDRKFKRGANPISKAKSFPWIVIYCGANARVEQVIASTCEELNVTWRKEYFGGW